METTTDRDRKPADADGAALKRRLLTRVAVAALLIALLVGGLALFDRLNAPAPMPTLAAPPLQPPQAGAIAPPAVEPPAVEEAQAPEEVAAEPESSAAPVMPEPEPEPKLKETQKYPSAGAAAHRTVPTSKAPVPGLAGKPTAEPRAAIKPAPATTETRLPATTRVVTAVRRYVLQLGMFNNVTNAEEMRAKLEANGIPTQLEIRVQVGPFPTRKEAEAASSRLKALGFEPGLIRAVNQRAGTTP